MSALESKENFWWHPYVDDLKNWCFVSHYKENEQFVDVDDGSNCDLGEELRCFGVCLCADEIFGLNCVEKYMPYMVAVQFGMDQDVPPGEFTFMSPSCNGNFSLYVPAKCYKPCVSLEYHNWWKKSKVDDSDMLDVAIAKQYCDVEKHASIGSKRRLSSNDESKVKKVNGNSSIEVVEAKRLKKNE
ncbi:hypothetical protein RYX36_005618 [Vicia faba]